METIEFDIMEGQFLRVPCKEKYPNGVEIISNVDNSSECFTLVLEWIICHGTFEIGPKKTKKNIICVKNCQFDNLVGPNDGTVLEIDEDSKKFIESKSQNPIQGFTEVTIIS